VKTSLVGFAGKPLEALERKTLSHKGKELFEAVTLLN
jgi:hypothetical protein